ncbi:MAG: hypothetical protein IKM04_02160 [Clostridia bacterium]|nr:hypothetical protein [Clostridia bacterium]
MEKKLDAAGLWRLYRRGVDSHSREQLYDRTARAFRFFEGDQWHGIESDEQLPTLNFIQPTVEYKTAMVAMQNLSIYYSPLDPTAFPGSEEVCRSLNLYAAKQWEHNKMDSLLWDAVREACIAGDSYLFFYDSRQHAQIVSNTSLYLADETQRDIQKQRYIIIAERRPIEEVRREARANGIKKEDIDLILSDGDTDTVVSSRNADDSSADDMCTCILYMRRGEDGFIYFTRSVRNVIYQPEQCLKGLRLYPIASFAWLPKKGSARGVGEVVPLIQNQIEVNRLLARRLISAKLNAFAKPVYVENMLENPEDAENVGRAIRIKTGSVQRVNDIFTYVSPAPMSGEAAALQNELISKTQELSGAGDAALGMINPEKASGAAILAVQDQSAIPLNGQIAAYKQLVEDIALVWFDLLCAYHTEGLTVDRALPEGGTERTEITPLALESLKVSVRIDAAPTNPFSRYAREQALSNALTAGYITFEEWVSAIDTDASAPKAEFERILENRKSEIPSAGTVIDTTEEI